MKILAADDEQLALKLLVETIQEAEPKAEIHGFKKVSEVLKSVEKNDWDVAFLDIEMRGKSGIELAKELKKYLPRINIIFVTGYSEFMGEAFALHASGYILKPVTVEQIQEELKNLRNPPKKDPVKGKLYIHTFGNFEVFYGEEMLHFSRARSKELFAYLVDRKGASVTMAELASVLWEDQEYNRSLLNQIHTFLSDLIKQLKEFGHEDVIIKKRNSVALNVEKVDCDYFRFLNGEPAAMNLFTGEYMANYSWAEFTVGSLSNPK